MIVLGVHMGHDSSCAVVKDGRVLADAQEERFVRVKHSSNVPTLSLGYCLQAAGLDDINDVDCVALGWKNTPRYLKALLGIPDRQGYKQVARKILSASGVGISIGHSYSLVTEALHWWHGDGEGKTMGLAPYGDPEKCRGVLDKYFPRVEGPEVASSNGLGRTYYWVESGATQFHFEEAQEVEALAEKYGKENLAAEAQRKLEECVTELVFAWVEKTGIRRTAFGAALHAYHRSHPFHGTKLDTLYWGPEFSDDYVEALLKERNLAYEPVEDPSAAAAEMLADGKIVAWFQGRMESGPRALGNRSILMSPCRAENKDIINARVKFREGFRPFCPSILYERAFEYLCDAREEYFMITSFDVKPEHRDKLPAVTPVDGTVRPQMVSRDMNERYWRLIDAFGKRTGVYAVLNTSMNIKGEPMINTPQEAIRCLFDTGLDALALGRFVLKKPLSFKAASRAGPRESETIDRSDRTRLAAGKRSNARRPPLVRRRLVRRSPMVGREDRRTTGGEMTADEARELFAYGVWANGRVFDAVEALTPEQLTTQVASSFPSVRGTLGHIVAAEWVWLRRWLGESPAAMPDWVSGTGLAELRGRLAAVEAERDQFSSTLADAGLERVIEYRTIAGKAHADPLVGLVRHVVNHSTYHRGQVATQMRHVGIVPPTTDLIAYMRRVS